MRGRVAEGVQKRSGSYAAASTQSDKSPHLLLSLLDEYSQSMATSEPDLTEFRALLEKQYRRPFTEAETLDAYTRLATFMQLVRNGMRTSYDTARKDTSADDAPRG